MTRTPRISAGFFKSLVQALDRPVLVLDEELRVLMMNAAAERITGVPLRRAAGRFGGDLVGMDRATCAALGFAASGDPAWKDFVCRPAGADNRMARGRGRAMPLSEDRPSIVWVLEPPDDVNRSGDLLAGAPVILFELNGDGILVYGADQIAEALEIEPSQVAGRRLADLVVEDQRRSFSDLWRKVVAGEPLRSAEMRLIHRRGSPRPFWVSLFPIRDARGVTLGVRGVAGDLSGQKDLAYALESSEERFSVLFRESSDPILILTMDGEILLANPSFEQVIGIQSDELFSGARNWDDFVLPEDCASLREHIRRCAREDRDGLAEFRVRDAGGRTLWFEQSHSILHDEAGRVRGIMAVARNIHHRKQYETELREQAEDMQRRHDRAQALISRLKMFFAQTSALAPDPGVFLQGVCDILFEMYDPLVVMINRVGERRVLFRVRPNAREALGTPTIESLPCGVCGQIAETGMPFYSNTLDTAPPPNCPAKVGSIGLRTCLGAPLRDSTGKIWGSILLLDDKARAFDSLDVEVVTVAALQVAARLRAEEQDEIQRDLEEHLRQAQKMEAVGMLAGGIAHDFNNALSSILGFTSYLMAKAPAGSNLLRDLGLIEQSAMRAADLTRQLLAFARRRHFAKEPVSLNTVIEDVLGILKRSFPANITIRAQLAPDLPGVLGDRGQLNQVIMNLCINAAEAMTEKGGELTLTTEHRLLTAREHVVLAEASEDEYVCVSVTDTGKGIGPEEQARIFDPFYTTKTASGGTGLGLSIVYGIVTNHKGHIRVESEAGKGAAFQLYFPARGVSGVKVEEPAPARKLAGTEAILVVEDEPIVRQMAVEVLKAYGYKVLSASTGEEALDLFRNLEGGADLVFLDLLMPGIGGEATFHELRKLDPNARVLLTSGFVREDITERLIAEGAAGILYKPCSSEALVAAIRDALDRPASSPAGGPPSPS